MYKEEIEAILDKDRHILNPKSYIDSSQKKEDSDDIGIDEIFHEKIGKRSTNKRENKEIEINQNKKKPKNNFKNTIYSNRISTN